MTIRVIETSALQGSSSGGPLMMPLPYNSVAF